MFKLQEGATKSSEIIEVLSCSVVPQISAHITFSFSSFNSKDKIERRFGSVMFPCPVRVDMYDDEGSNLNFNSESGFAAASKEIPGVLVSRNSSYLKEFLKKEDWVKAHSGDKLNHYVVWSYGGGVVHVLTANLPTIEEI